ncbi:SCO family protein [Shinella sp. HZN7]|jgi:protein SCO1/2|uniref:SCO family protein n=1 Tax=Shinella sp. (strain HZN7) TaxID=879274 RepID=UPI0007DA4BE2|nr:SCO family protein [Shinella sp. HZN7]ANH03163.1 copper-binding protein [Shinella sp. HZN7]
MRRRALLGLAAGLVAIVAVTVAARAPSGEATKRRVFELETVDGTLFRSADLAGKPYLVFFGFTHCPDVCPTALFELSGLLKDIGPAADRITPLFISIDPERDTADLLKLYMTSFDPRIIALRGDAAQTKKVADAFSAFYRKVPTASDSYTMEHTAGLFLIRADGRLQGMLDMHEPRETQLRKLRLLAGA